MEIADFSSPETDSGKAWLQPIGQEYEVEEVHVLRNAHLALHPNITRFVLILIKIKNLKLFTLLPLCLSTKYQFLPTVSSFGKAELPLFFRLRALGIPTIFFLEHRLFLIFLSFLVLLYRPHGLKVYSFVGDGTGVIHVGPNQIVISQMADHELFAVNVFVHKDGHFHLPPTFSCYGIQITTR